MNATEIMQKAKAEGWKRAQVKAACYEFKVPTEQREEIYAALGMAATGPATPAPAPEVAAAPRAETSAADNFGNMTLKFPAIDKLTGLPLPAGTRVIGVRLGGEWDFTAVRTDPKNFRKACEAALLSNSPDGGELDSTDYRLLASYGKEFPYFQKFIAIEIPGLAN